MATRTNNTLQLGRIHRDQVLSNSMFPLQRPYRVLHATSSKLSSHQEDFFGGEKW